MVADADVGARERAIARHLAVRPKADVGEARVIALLLRPKTRPQTRFG
jgi:hypothetical protein